MNIERASFVEGIRAIAESVYSFHDRFDIPRVDTADTEATLEALRQRLAIIAEEIGEYASALNQGDVEDAASEAADVGYVALGTILRLGDLGRLACIEIARKNDAKVPSTHSERSSTGKVLRS